MPSRLAGRDRERPQRAISTADSCRAVDDAEECVDLVGEQEIDRPLLVALARDRQDALALVSESGLSQRDIAEERVERRQPSVAGSSTIVAVRLEILEKVDDKRCVQIFEEQQRWRLGEALLRESEQDPEAIAIG